MLQMGPSRSTDKDVWTAQADLSADVENVLFALTDPDLIASWALCNSTWMGSRTAGCTPAAASGSMARCSA